MEGNVAPWWPWRHMGSGGTAPLIPSLSTIWKLISSTQWSLCPTERAHSTRQIGDWVGPISCWMLPLLRTGRQFRNIIWMCATGISFVISTNLCYLYLRLSIWKFKHIRSKSWSPAYVTHVPAQQCWSNKQLLRATTVYHICTAAAKKCSNTVDQNTDCTTPDTPH